MIELKVPDGSTVRNYLYQNMDLADLNQDLLLIVLPSGICIDVGWFPENDPDGHFYLRVFQGREEISGWELKTLSEVVVWIERNACRLLPANGEQGIEDEDSDQKTET